MQTDPSTLRYMAAMPGGKMAINSYTIRAFDHLSDAMAYAQRVNASFVYELSPIKNPRKISVHKYLRGE